MQLGCDSWRKFLDLGRIRQEEPDSRRVTVFKATKLRFPQSFVWYRLSSHLDDVAVLSFVTSAQPPTDLSHLWVSTARVASVRHILGLSEASDCLDDLARLPKRVGFYGGNKLFQIMRTATRSCRTRKRAFHFYSTSDAATLQRGRLGQCCCCCCCV